MSFVHLHAHSEYSLSDGLLRIPELAEALEKMRMPAMAITELANLHSTVKFYRALSARGIKPVIGAELYFSPPRKKHTQSRVLFLCQHNDGYVNLSRLVTRSFTEGYQYGTPTIRPEWLEGEAGAGLIVIHTMEHGVLSLHDRPRRLEQDLAFWQRHFPGRCYLEICRVGRDDEAARLSGLLAFAVRHALPVIASNDVRFLQREDYEAHEARVCINQSRILGESDNREHYYYTDQQYLRSAGEMQELFQDLPQALENTMEIAMRCNVELSLGEFFLPHFPIPEGSSEDALLNDNASRGLDSRLAAARDRGQVPDQDAYRKRLHEELAIIHDMKYSGYFLIVQDFVCWAKSEDIPVGPGRGSGAGSLVAWALGITEVDPLHFDLLFERFLNPERVSLPDFDIDFCMQRRDEVIEYVTKKYGSDRVARIATYSTMAARAALRDVGRVLAMPYGFVDEIVRLVPPRLDMTLKGAMKEEALLALRYQKEEEVRTLFDLAMKLEGLVRNVGTHAGGLVVAPSPLTEYMPLYREERSDLLTTQFDMGDVETMGLVKFDFLGLRTLTIIDWSLHDINAQRAARGQQAIDINALALDDTSTYELIKAADTTAVFQLESDKLRSYMKTLKPDSFATLFAMVALYRPGPIGAGMVNDFIERQHGADFSYLHESLRPILQPTMGVIIYQEQVMQIAQVMAGYSLGSADLLRRAMSKKNPAEMAEQRAVFMCGASDNDIPTAIARQVFDQMQHFAGYGFNKAHSVSYALIAFQTAWLKAHYPAQFMAAVLSADMDNTDKVALFLADVRRRDIGIHGPSVNRSAVRFSVTDSGNIRYGMGAIKGVGVSAAGTLVHERQAQGPFADIFDLCQRVSLQKVNRRTLDALVQSGAMDEFADSRARLMADLDTAVSMAGQHDRDQEYGQHDMFGLSPAADVKDQAPVCEWQPMERLRREKMALGLYFSGHPLQLYEQELVQIVSHRLPELQEHIGSVVTVGACVQSCRPVGRGRTGRGRRFELQVSDHQNSLTVQVPGELATTSRRLLAVDQLLIITGNLARDRFSMQGYSLGAQEIYNLDGYRNRFAALELALDSGRVTGSLPGTLRDILARYRPGHCQVRIQYNKDGARGRIDAGPDWSVRLDDDLLCNLRELLGQDGVRVVY